MSKVSLTVKQIINLGLWDKVCEYKGWNPWCYNEGQIDSEEIIEFDDEFKKEEDIIEEQYKSPYLEIEEDLKNIIYFDVKEEFGCVDEWSESSAFHKCKEIAKEILDKLNKLTDKDNFINVLQNQNPIKGWTKNEFTVKEEGDETTIELDDVGFVFDNESGKLLGTFNYKQ